MNDLIRNMSVPAGWDKNISLSFYTLIAIGAWSAAVLVMLSTKGRLGYSGEPIVGPEPKRNGS